MGTWDDGLLDNDTAADGLGELSNSIVEDIAQLGALRPTAPSTERLGAAVGLLLQLSAYDFDPSSTSAPVILAALEAHRENFARLSPGARRLLLQILDGKGKELAERPAKLSPAQIALLRAGKRARSPFGKREASLFATKAAAAYAQEVGKRCIEAIHEDFEDEGNWSDLCREGIGMGHLAFLLVLSPSRIPVGKLKRWRRCAARGIAALEKNPDDELDFHRGYYAKLDRVFALLLRRHAA